MAEADWTFMTGALDAAAVARGVTAGVGRPNGGGQFVYGFNSLAVVRGAVALFASVPDFAPMAKGGSIRACVSRGPGGGPTRFSPFLFMCAQGPSVGDTAYMLGLSDDEPHHIVLRKAAIANGAGAASDAGVILRSGETFVQSSWLHLRLDVVVNPNGDVALSVFRNDLDVHAIGTAPVWQPIVGMAPFIDDKLGINTGAPPLTSGRAGFGFAVNDTTRRGFFDEIEILRQAS